MFSFVVRNSTESGAGGSRTLVQTRKQYAFYMLIFALIFVLQQDQSYQLLPYPLLFRCPYKATTSYPRFVRTSVSNRLGERAFERCLVLTPCIWMKLNLLYSIKQQERNYFRQLLFWNPGLTSRHSDARHAYIPFLPAVKTKQPQNRFFVINNKLTILMPKSQRLKQF